MSPNFAETPGNQHVEIEICVFYLLGLGIRFFKRIPNLSGVLNSQFQISDCIN